MQASIGRRFTIVARTHNFVIGEVALEGVGVLRNLDRYSAASIALEMDSRARRAGVQLSYDIVEEV